jgi:hypothetical protein
VVEVMLTDLRIWQELWDYSVCRECVVANGSVKSSNPTHSASPDAAFGGDAKPQCFGESSDSKSDAVWERDAKSNAAVDMWRVEHHYDSNSTSSNPAPPLRNHMFSLGTICQSKKVEQQKGEPSFGLVRMRTFDVFPMI